MRSNYLWRADELESPMGNAPRVIHIRYWTNDDIQRLVKLAAAQATTRQIALELGRSPLAVRLKASRMGLPLTAHEVRRSARRHAKRQGKAAVAEVKNLRQRPRVTITVDFDLSSLTRHERRQLAERLRVMAMEEQGVNPESAPPDEEFSAPRRRKLRIHREYDPSAATSARHREANARRHVNRESLGWNRSGAPMDEDAQLLAEVRGMVRRLRGAKRSRKGEGRVSLEEAEGELGVVWQAEVEVDEDEG